MASRRRAREYALQMLYEAETSGEGLDGVVSHFWSDSGAPAEVRAFAERLAAGTVAAQATIDRLLRGSLDNWRLERLGIVDRNVLRLAVYEFLHERDTPRVVIIDEAIEVAKRFGGEDSGHFVNGILDALRKKLEATAAG